MNKREHPQLEFLKALNETYYLVEISKDLISCNENEKRITNIIKKKQALYMCTIVNLCASWELFIEALIGDSLECIINYSEKSDQLPNNLKNRIALELLEKRKNHNPEIEIWKISDDGWKNLLKENHLTLKSRFNTPKTDNVNDFVYKTIGLKDISKNWKWKNHSIIKSKNKLNNFIKIRGNIAHRITNDSSIYFNTIDNYIDFLYRLSTLSSNAVRKHIYEMVGMYPWEEHKFQSLYKE